MTDAPDKTVEGVRRIFDMMIADDSDQPSTVRLDGGSMQFSPKYRAAFRKVLAEKMVDLRWRPIAELDGCNLPETVVFGRWSRSGWHESIPTVRRYVLATVKGSLWQYFFAYPTPPEKKP